MCVDTLKCSTPFYTGRHCWTYQLGPLISVISLTVGNKGLIGADGLQPTRPLGPFTFPDKFVSSLIGHINHCGPSEAFDCLLLHYALSLLEPMEGAVKQKGEQPIPAHTGTQNGPLMAIAEYF